LPVAGYQIFRVAPASLSLVPRWATSLAIALALAGLVAWSFAERWGVLASSPFPLGVDGYFYPLEVRSLLEHGALAFPASPLTFWWMAPFAAITDPITGAKLAAALGGALVALPAYGVGARLARSRAAGLVAAAVATLSAGSAYLSIEFVKQGIGLTVALAALLAVLRAAETPSRARVATAAAALLATVLAHKLAAALVITLALAIALQEARGRGVLRGRRLLYLVTGLVGFAVVLAVLGAISPQRFASVSDLGRVTDALFTDPRWADAALVRGKYVLLFDHEALIGLFAALAAAAVLWSRRPQPPSGARVAALGLIVLAIVIAPPWLAITDPQGLGFRLRLAAFVPLAMCTAIVAGALPDRARGIACVCIAAAIACVPRDRDEGKVFAYPQLVASALALADHVPAGATLIVPERHVEFMVAWYTRAPVSARPEPIPYAKRVRVVLPLSSVNERFPLGAALAAARAEPLIDPPIALHPQARDGFVVVPEATWDWILAQLPQRSREHYARWPTI
jgi:hypothetical protein